MYISHTASKMFFNTSVYLGTLKKEILIDSKIVAFITNIY